jgi:hypothetical protein
LRKKTRKRLTELAIDIRIPDIAGDTRANHGALRQRVLHAALRVAPAGPQLCAGVPADLLKARLPTRAVAVNPTLGLHRLRDCKGG